MNSIIKGISRIFLAEVSRITGFYPHEFKTTVTLSRIPRVIITRKVYERMWHYVDILPTEVGWLGTVERHGDDFLITDVFILDQRVTGSTTVISADGIANFANELLQADPEAGMNTLNAMRFWGHSHGNLQVFASSQDERQMEIFAESGQEWFVRGIFNKHGVAKFTVYLYEIGLVADDVEWLISDPADLDIRKEVEDEIATKVKNQPTHYPRDGQDRKSYSRVTSKPDEGTYFPPPKGSTGDDQPDDESGLDQPYAINGDGERREIARLPEINSEVESVTDNSADETVAEPRSRPRQKANSSVKHSGKRGRNK